MFRTIFHKMMAIFVVVLLLCFVCAAVFFNLAITRYVTNQRTEFLDVYGERISSALEVLLNNRMDPSLAFIFQSRWDMANNTSSLLWIVDDMESVCLFLSSRTILQKTAKIKTEYTSLPILATPFMRRKAQAVKLVIFMDYSMEPECNGLR